MLTTANAKTTQAYSWLQIVLIKALRFYQILLRPAFGNRCRFLPTCSEYALEAIQCHGCGKGLYLTAHRLCRCNPCMEGGYDPVPRQAPPEGGFDTPAKQGHALPGSHTDKPSPQQVGH